MIFAIVRGIHAAHDGAAAGEMQGLIGAFDAELRHAPDNELVDIAVIVGEQYPGLHVAPMGAGIMLDALQGIIHPHRIEHGQRQGVGRHVVPMAIGDFIAHQIKAGHGEMQGQFNGLGAFAAQVIALVEDVGVGDFLEGDAHLDGGGVVLHQIGELVHEVAAEMGGLGNGCDIGAGALEFGEGARDRRLHPLRLVGHAQLGVAKTAALVGRGGLAGGKIAVKAGFQAGGGLGMELNKLVYGGLGGKILGRHHLAYSTDARIAVATASAWGPVAQWLELTAHNRLVPGSNPGGPTTPNLPINCRKFSELVRR